MVIKNIGFTGLEEIDRRRGKIKIKLVLTSIVNIGIRSLVKAATLFLITMSGRWCVPGYFSSTEWKPGTVVGSGGSIA